MEKIITYCGQLAKIKCDEKCNKAWGWNGRPNVQLSDDLDDIMWFGDDELEDAPINSIIKENGQGKPVNENGEQIQNLIPNAWCVRECERCVMSMPNEYLKELKIKDWSNRRYNIPSSEGKYEDDFKS